MSNVTIITGAAGGIGQAIASRLAAPGAGLALVGRSQHALAALAEELRECGAEVVCVPADLQTVEGPAGAVAQTVAHFGRLDGVVSNAGVMRAGRLSDIDVEEYERTFAVNTRATFLLAQAAHPHLRETGGTLVAIASMAASDPAPLGAYSASKAALLMLVRTFAREWGADGIRVNAVSPGMIMTPMSPAANDPELRRSREARIPLGRTGEPDDVAAVVSFLLGDDARYVTGENIAVDGGVRGNYVAGVIGLS